MESTKQTAFEKFEGLAKLEGWTAYTRPTFKSIAQRVFNVVQPNDKQLVQIKLWLREASIA